MENVVIFLAVRRTQNLADALNRVSDRYSRDIIANIKISYTAKYETYKVEITNPDRVLQQTFRLIGDGVLTVE